MIKPCILKPMATIGVVCPSYFIDQNIFQKTAKIFTDKGYNIVEGKTIHLKDNLFAGSAKQRAQDLMDMFADPKIDSIFCARGGYGANRVLKHLDYKIVRNNPKIFLGFSDITALLISITQKTGLVTFHGPVLKSFNDGDIKYNLENILKIVSGNYPLKIALDKKDVKVLKEGKAKGALWGGNLTLLVNRLGTKDQLNTDGSILFIEDTNEELFRFDRMLYHFKEAGAFKNIKGLIVGELTNMSDTNPAFGKTTDEIILDICTDYNFPIISNFPCGHGKKLATLPISIKAELNVEENNSYLKILENPII